MRRTLSMIVRDREGNPIYITERPVKIRENRNPYGERGRCIKCVRTARAVGDILDLMRSQ